MTTLVSTTMNYPAIGKSISRYSDYGVHSYGGYFSDPEFLVDFPLVGSRDERTNERCCSPSGALLACMNSSGHTGVLVPDGVLGQRSLDGCCLKRMAVLKVLVFHCTDPLCPVCSRHWANLQCARAVGRFDVFEKSDKFVLGLGLVHVTVSVPFKDYHLDLVVLRKRSVSKAVLAGLVGSMCIFHPKRWNHVLKMWYFSPHFHFLGYASGGWLDGAVCKRIEADSGYLVKNLGLRGSSIDRVRTIMYILSHAGVPFGSHHAVTWFGSLSYRRVLVPKFVKVPEKCPLCNHDCVHVKVNSLFFKDSQTFCRVFEDKTVLVPVVWLDVVPRYGGW